MIQNKKCQESHNPEISITKINKNMFLTKCIPITVFLILQKGWKFFIHSPQIFINTLVNNNTNLPCGLSLYQNMLLSALYALSYLTVLLLEYNWYKTLCKLKMCNVDLINFISQCDYHCQVS